MKSQSDTLKTSRSSGGAGVDEDLESSFMGSQSKGADMRQRDMIRKLERERKEHQEVSTKGSPVIYMVTPQFKETH